MMDVPISDEMTAMTDALFNSENTSRPAECPEAMPEYRQRAHAILYALRYSGWTLTSNPIASDSIDYCGYVYEPDDSIEPVPVVCASCGFPWGMDPVRHAEICDNRQALATPEQGEK